MILVLHVTTFVHSFVGDPLRQDTSAKIFFFVFPNPDKEFISQITVEKHRALFISEKKNPRDDPGVPYLQVNEQLRTKNRGNFLFFVK